MIKLRNIYHRVTRVHYIMPTHFINKISLNLSGQKSVSNILLHNLYTLLGTSLWRYVHDASNGSRALITDLNTFILDIKARFKKKMLVFFRQNCENIVSLVVFTHFLYSCEKLKGKNIILFSFNIFCIGFFAYYYIKFII